MFSLDDFVKEMKEPERNAPKEQNKQIFNRNTASRRNTNFLYLENNLKVVCHNNFILFFHAKIVSRTAFTKVLVFGRQLKGMKEKCWLIHNLPLLYLTLFLWFFYKLNFKVNIASECYPSKTKHGVDVDVDAKQFHWI